MAIRDKKISGNAGPVIKRIGKKITRVEKKIISNFKDWSVKKDLNGEKKFIKNLWYMIY